MSSYKPGDIVWTKLAGYPWWPATVVAESDLQEDVLQAKRDDCIPIYFFGSYDYQWMTPNCIKAFEENFEKLSTAAKGKQFLIAVKESKDPDLFERNREKRMKISERKNSRKRSLDGDESDSFEVAKPLKKTIKPRKASLVITKQKIATAPEPDHSLERLSRLRTKLHAFLSTAEKSELDYKRAHSTCVELELFPVSLELLKETKIGKTLKKLTEIELSDNDLSAKFGQLLSKWKELLNPGTTEPEKAEEESEKQNIEEPEGQNVEESEELNVEESEKLAQPIKEETLPNPADNIAS